MALKSNRSKACDIPKAVKMIVYDRDRERCVLCGSNQGIPNAHYIPRSHGGLGVEQNVVTLCPNCHHRYDQTAERAAIKPVLAEYLKSQYPDWNESALYYNKYRRFI